MSLSTYMLDYLLVEIIAINLDTSSDNSSSDSDNNTSEEIDYDSPEYKGSPKSLLKWYGYLSDEYKDNGMFRGSKSGGNESDAKPSFSDILKAKAYSSDDRKGPSKASVPIFEGPSVQGLLDYYGYNDIEEYLSWNYFSSTDKDITDNDTTDQDCIHECNYAMSKDKAKGKRKESNFMVTSVMVLILHLQLAFASKHLQLAFASKHLQLAFAACICSLHLQLAFASKHLHLAFAG
ncbi:hypothetical protein Tco_0613626 [Tanacetum coccineum]